MLITLHMFSLSVVRTPNTQLKLLPFKWCTVLRQTVTGNFNLTPTVCSIRMIAYEMIAEYVLSHPMGHACMKESTSKSFQLGEIKLM